MSPAPLAAFPNVEDAITILLAAALDLADGRTGTRTPADLKARMPFVLAYRFAGADDGLVDRVELGVDVFAGTYAAGQPLAERTRQVLIAAPHVVDVPGIGKVLLDSVRTTAAPIEVPYGDDSVRRWTSTYRISVRRGRGA